MEMLKNWQGAGSGSLYCIRPMPMLEYKDTTAIDFKVQ